MRINAPKTNASIECDKTLNYEIYNHLSKEKKHHYNFLWKELKSGYFQISSV